MRYFSGFGFGREAELFGAWIPRGDMTVAGFSYGAQRACEFVANASERVDRLVLLSPAFFHDKDEVFIQAQIDAFRRDETAYRKRFYRNVRFPSTIDTAPYEEKTSIDDLEALLRYRWDAETLRTIASRGTTIEVILGGRDRIIDAQAAFDFFSPLATTYLIKEAGHLLRRKEDDGV